MVKIIADSTCDLSKELIERYDIAILPLHVLMDDKEYLDGVNITPPEIFKWSDSVKKTPGTSAPSMEETMNLFRQYLDQGMEIVSFSISASMSASKNVMTVAAESLDAEDRISVIDSANLSTGIGLLVIEAAIMAAGGKSREEITARMEELKPLVRASFVVDTLVFLHRGGRCGGLAAMAGGALKLHPRISVADGAMSSGKKYRGRIGKVYLTYAQDMEEELLKAYPDRVFITHTCRDEEEVSGVRRYLESLGYFNEILETRAGGVISSHCGPGTLGVLFIRKPQD